MNYTTAAYDRMVEDIKDRLGFEEYPGIVEDVANYGADGGFSGFIYTSDCVEFYEAHSDVIWTMLQEEADNFGYSNVPEFVGTFGRSDMADTEDGYKNLLAWYALEEVCRQLVDEGAHIPEEEEDEEDDDTDYSIEAIRERLHKMRQEQEEE